MSSKKQEELTPKELKNALIKAEEEVTEKLKSISKEALWVLLVGTTGSGKTTLLHAFAGRRLLCKTDRWGIDLVLYSDEPLMDEKGKPMIISDKIQAETYIPNIWVDKADNIVYVDCPGFLDTTISRRVINAFTIDLVLTNAKNVKILWVIEQNEFKGKSLNARESVDILEKMLPNNREKREAIECIVTHYDKKVEPCAYLKKLWKGLMDEGKEFDLLDFLANNSKVFSFPLPKEVGPYTLFKQKEELVASFKREYATEPEHRVVVDERTESLVVLMVTQFADEKGKAIQLLTDTMLKTIKELDKDMEVIEKWTTRVIELEHAAKGGWSELCAKCKALSREEPIFEEPSKEMAKQEQWDGFVEKMKKSDGSKKIEQIMNVVMERASHQFELMEEILKHKKEFAQGNINASQYDSIMKIIEQQMEENRRIFQELLTIIRDKGENAIGEFFRKIGDGLSRFVSWLAENASDIYNLVKDFIV